MQNIFGVYILIMLIASLIRSDDRRRAAMLRIFLLFLSCTNLLYI